MRLADTFFLQKTGRKISNPTQKIQISSCAQFTKKSLKHFIESRKKAGQSKKEIHYLLEKAPEVTTNPQIEITNPNKTYPNSLLLGRFYTDVNKAVMVVLNKDGNVRDIISLHFKKKSGFEELLKTYRQK